MAFQHWAASAIPTNLKKLGKESSPKQYRIAHLAPKGWRHYRITVQSISINEGIDDLGSYQRLIAQEKYGCIRSWAYRPEPSQDGGGLSLLKSGVERQANRV